MARLANLGMLLLALLLTALLTPGVIRLCRRYKTYDKPGARKVHHRSVPRLGGVAIFIALSLGMTAAVFAVLGGFVELPPEYSRLLPVIYLGLCGFFFIGFWDDLRSLPAWPRLLAQIAVAAAVVLASGPGGVRIASAFGHYVFPAWLSVLLTVVWIVGLVNCFNWIDGLDGLAAGAALISASAFFVLVSVKPGLPNAVLTAALCALLIGAVLGFLPYNFHPAKVFVGDGGAFALGYMLAVISVVGLFKTAAVVSFMLPVVILALPITDTLFAILRRVLHGQSPAAPDDKHIHHRMLALLSRRYRQSLPVEALTRLEERLVEARAHRNTVLALYGFAAVFAAIAVAIGLRS
jgi:UDP-N-acetylmuramyl pentapeptide phosphotransferase/UDP-N-acetylglucosamine-1-phosphate transferase